MTRIIIALFAGCAVVTGSVAAFDEAADSEPSFEEASPDQLRAKIVERSTRIAELKREFRLLKLMQKRQAELSAAIPPWLRLTDLLSSPGAVSAAARSSQRALPRYQDSLPVNPDHLRVPRADQGPFSRMPDGTLWRPFNGMVVYEIPCIFEQGHRGRASGADLENATSAGWCYGGNRRYSKRVSYRWPEIQ